MTSGSCALPSNLVTTGAPTIQLSTSWGNPLIKSNALLPTTECYIMMRRLMLRCSCASDEVDGLVGKGKPAPKLRKLLSGTLFRPQPLRDKNIVVLNIGFLKADLIW